jgi:hypothetical protein
MTRIYLVAAAMTLSLAAPLAAQTWSSNAPVIGPVNQPEGLLMHPYPAAENHCPNRLQPVTLGGVICCGTPNTEETFYNAGGSRKRSHGMSCPPGGKGCS